MKPWEMVKELDENPDRVFEDGCGNYLKFTDEGSLAWHSLTGEFYGLYTVRRNDATNWNLVRQPVTWQEAIKAWADGKMVSYKYPDDEVIYQFKDSNRMMCIEKIKDATWYVED